ncbi:hypothetical protein [Virgisporangium aliadipatigenens]|uniref:hypothetical protein n=1 Tax=Virgisporangium aliadipatigenens TaxID=741659 RepID=UPI001941CDCC|nr:hypothetical protein [Virgisporangium aliadipatigenens]
MNALRITWIEARRSAALWLGALGAAVAAAMLGDPERWDGLWMQTVLVHQANLALLWPFAVAAGAWQGRRDHAARVGDLVRAAPRPGASRVAPLAFVLAGALGGGWIAASAPGIGRAVLAASYRPPGWYWPLLVGGLAMGAAGLLGLGLGRLLPSRLTAPLLGVAGVVLSVVPLVIWRGSDAPALLLVPGNLGESTDEWATVATRADVGQALWFAGLAAAGWALYAGARYWSAVPAVIGLAAAVLVLPAADRAAPRDVHAVELVCADGTPRVCVTRLYEPILPALVGPAREALALLAKLPDPPTSVVQETAPYASFVAQRRDTVHLLLTVYGDGSTLDLTNAVLDGAGTWACGAPDDDLATWDRILAAREAAALWLRGGTSADPLVADALNALRALPAADQAARVGAMREAALACRKDQYETLLRPN